MSKAAALSWRLGAAEVRDARHVHDGPEVVGGPSKRKDTKRWCKGKVGREHTVVVRDATDLGKRRFRMQLIRCCATCGKELETWWAPWKVRGTDGVEREILMNRRKPMPDWVREHLASKAA